MKIKVIILLACTFCITGCFTSKNTASLFLKDAVSKPVYIYKSSRSNKVTAVLREDTLLENWNDVTIEKIRKKRYYVSVSDIFHQRSNEIRGWINKDECAVYLKERGIQVDNPNYYDYYVIRFFNKPADRKPAIVLTSDDHGVFDNIKSYTVAVTDVKVIDDCYPYDTWLRVLVELKTGETLEMWTVDYDGNVYGNPECPPASRLQEILDNRPNNVPAMCGTYDGVIVGENSLSANVLLALRVDHSFWFLKSSESSVVEDRGEWAVLDDGEIELTFYDNRVLTDVERTLMVNSLNKGTLGVKVLSKNKLKIGDTVLKRRK